MHYRQLAPVAFAVVAAITATACQDTKTRTPFVTPFTPTAVVTGNTPIFYLVSGREGQGVNVTFEYSTDRGVTWKPATPVAGEPPSSVIVARPEGANAIFFWNSFADLGPGV